MLKASLNIYSFGEKFPMALALSLLLNWHLIEAAMFKSAGMR